MSWEADPKTENCKQEVYPRAPSGTTQLGPGGGKEGPRLGQRESETGVQPSGKRVGAREPRKVLQSHLEGGNGPTVGTPRRTVIKYGPRGNVTLSRCLPWADGGKYLRSSSLSSSHCSRGGNAHFSPGEKECARCFRASLREDAVFTERFRQRGEAWELDYSTWNSLCVNGVVVCVCACVS